MDKLVSILDLNKDKDKDKDKDSVGPGGIQVKTAKHGPTQNEQLQIGNDQNIQMNKKWSEDEPMDLVKEPKRSKMRISNNEYEPFKKLDDDNPFKE